MAELIGLGKRFAVLAPLGVRFRDCVVPEVGKFSVGGIGFEVLDLRAKTISTPWRRLSGMETLLCSNAGTAQMATPHMPFARSMASLRQCGIGMNQMR
jgi:hypothetical protein